MPGQNDFPRSHLGTRPRSCRRVAEHLKLATRWRRSSVPLMAAWWRSRSRSVGPSGSSASSSISAARIGRIPWQPPGAACSVPSFAIAAQNEQGAEGLRLARALAMATYRSPAEFEQRFAGRSDAGRWTFPIPGRVLFAVAWRCLRRHLYSRSVRVPVGVHRSASGRSGKDSRGYRGWWPSSRISSCRCRTCECSGSR